MSREPTFHREAMLRQEFPAWRIRAVTGQWIAARQGVAVVVRSSAHELQEAMRRAELERSEVP